MSYNPLLALELNAVLKDLSRHLEWQASAGGTSILAAPRTAQHASPARPVAEPVPPGDPASPSAQSALPLGDATVAVPQGSPLRETRSLEEIREDLGDCRRCKLCSGRTHLVFGVGNPHAKLVFVGEGPGAEEDAQGIPFVGKAGQLLTKMIEAMGFSRDEVYICNVIKCRPPNNRNPEPDEIESCEPFLKAQLGAISPQVIVALGKFAAQTLLREQTAITRLRGNWRQYCGIPLMPTFHPAYLLRNPAEKRSAWSDLRQVMRRFGREAKGRPE